MTTRRSHSAQLFAIAVALAAMAMIGCGPNGVTPDDRPDDGGVADAVVADAIGPDLGTPCDDPTDCPGGYCVDSPAGDVCTYACAGPCPPGWECRITDVGGELVSVCAPGAFDVCTRCAADDECTAGVCVDLEGAGYCLPACFEDVCPPGYTCGDDPTGAHPGGRFCVPDTTSCTCTVANAGAVRTCTSTTMVGTCTGFETCDPALGWVGCTAATAAPETCDGLDNDCDHLIDDGTTGACSIDVAGVGSCAGTQVCTGAGGLVCQGQTPMAERCNSVNDDCDGLTDEGFPGLGNACMAGVGGCQRSGVVRCTASGMGTACSAVAGMPVAETCNGIDDNCNGGIDDPFVDLDQICNVGVGVCVRQGSRICRNDGTGTTCSATPGQGAAETCNLLDDDCDGRADEDFIDPMTGLYDRDNACGSCAVDCTELFDLPNASGSCDSTGMPFCTLACDVNAFDLDGVPANGCELVLDPGAIYVSTNDPASLDDASCGLGPVGSGAGNHPCITIARGLARAASTGRARVLVANGLYPESVTIADGKSLLGGHAPDDWQRDVAATGTLITGIASSGNHDITVVATGISSATLFEGFVVYGAINGKPAGNSYAIYVSGSNANLAIRRNVIFAGRGGPGTAGPGGTDGATGTNGIGRASDPTAYDAHDATGAGACNASNNRSYTNGAPGTCGGDIVSGGNGGGNRCPPSTIRTELSALDGLTGQPGAGAGGGGAGVGADAGDDLILDTNGTLCRPPNAPYYGLDGGNGVDGQAGAMALGCAGPAGSVVAGHWVGGGGSNGTAGSNGGGGGGGGAGGGAYCLSCPGNKDRLGGHGGGAGAGGCGGAGGSAASSGGGAFAVFVVGNAPPSITGNTLARGEGGPGATGGPGGTAGRGGMGAGGGSDLFCTGTAGRGGNGGHGGHGAGGGGGCGGSSVAIYTSGLGAPVYCQAASGNTFFGGAGGSGGAGGYSIINPGGAGAAGTLLDCSFN